MRYGVCGRGRKGSDRGDMNVIGITLLAFVLALAFPFSFAPMAALRMLLLAGSATRSTLTLLLVILL